MHSLQSIPIYVVTVKTFFERHAHMAELEERLGVKFEYIWNYDAQDLSNEDCSRISGGMARESISNVLKHFEAQRRFLNTEASVCLVLEDDVLLFDDFEESLQTILGLVQDIEPGWLVFLGGADNKIDGRFLEKTEVLIEQYLSTAEAYLLDRHGCERRFEWLELNKIDRQADHQIKLIDQQLGTKHYWFSEPLATQGSITGLFDTALDSSRAKHGAMYLKARFHWNRFRRQIAPRFFARIFGTG